MLLLLNTGLTFLMLLLVFIMIRQRPCLEPFRQTKWGYLILQDIFISGKWGPYFKRVVEAIASASNDPSTKVGALLVTPKHNIILTGYNGFPKNVIDSKERWKRPEKYLWVVHAEQNLLNTAANLGISVNDNYVVLTHNPCLPCLKNMLTSGVKGVYYVNDLISPLIDDNQKEVMAATIREYQTGGNSGFFITKLP